MSGMVSVVLQRCLGRTVFIRLKSGREIKGKLVGFDRHLNLFMEEVEKITGDLSNVKRLETIILRGDSILFIFLPRL